MESRAVIVPQTLYVYGVSISFNDSVVYITDIMELDSAWIDTKNNFLYARSSYSYQLKSYLQEKGVADPTSVISYDVKRKKAEKKYLKLKSKYLKLGDTYTLRYIPVTEFSFSAISAADDPSALTNNTKESIKSAKKAAKEARKAAKEARKSKEPKGRRPMPGGQNGQPSGPPPNGGMGGGMR